MLGVIVAWALMAAQDKPLAGSLPPPPPPPSREPGERRPGPLFISPMGEPFRGPDPVRQWFDGADTDHDGAVTLAEFAVDAVRFFARLDRGHDGEIDPDDIEFYETVLAPEIRTGGGAVIRGAADGGFRGRRGGGGGGGGRGGRRGGGGPPGGGEGGFGGAGAGGERTVRYGDTRRGAARFGFLDYPEPVTAADANLNRGVDAKEFTDAAADRFAMLDKNHDGKLSFGELPRLASPEGGRFGPGLRGRRLGGGERPAPDDGEPPRD